MLVVLAVLLAVVTLVLWLVWPPLAQAFLVLVVLALGYAHAVEPYWVQYREVEVGLKDLPPVWEGLRISLISDLHLGFAVSSGWLRRVFSEVTERQSDLILLAGDLLAGGTAGVPRAAQRLALLRAPLGVCAVLGNHDYYADTEALLETLRSVGVRLLRNQALCLEREGQRLWLVGLDDPGTGHDDLDLALNLVPDGAPAILLCHNPDAVEEVSERAVGLMLSGHTHGGQVCLPGLGQVFCFSRFYRRYSSGLFWVGPTALYVTRGLGKALLPFRFLCRPEVTLLTLRSL
jgi:predicted MPP superfamily phosphohydrolase